MKPGEKPITTSAIEPFTLYPSSLLARFLSHSPLSPFISASPVSSDTGSLVFSDTFVFFFVSV